MIYFGKINNNIGTIWPYCVDVPLNRNKQPNDVYLSQEGHNFNLTTIKIIKQI